MLYLQRISAMYQTGAFSKSDRQIADYLLDNPKHIENETAASLSAHIGVSPATIVRFCRKLGFQGLADMKQSAAQHGYIESSTDAMELSRGDDAETVKTKVIQYMKLIIDQLQVSLDAQALQRAADMFAGARQVVIISEGGSGTIARAAYDIFMKLAIPCRIVEDIIFQMMEISMMDKDDVLFLIVNSGRTINSIQNLAYAKEKGLRTVGIVGPKNSPLSAYLDVELTTSLFDSSYFSDISAARLCELAAVSILHSIMALSLDEKQINKGEEIAASIERKRTPLK